MFRNFGSTISVGIIFGALALVALGGCRGGTGDAPAGQENQSLSTPLSDEAQALVNEANTALREERHADALALFGEAMGIHPDHPVPQFGSLMAATALGDTALVRSLREKLAVTGPELLQMFGPDAAMGGSDMPGAGHMPGAGALPEGHPSLEGAVPDTTLPPVGARG